MPNFAMTREEHTKAVLNAIEETFQKANRSKETARKFLIELGVIEDEKVKLNAKSAKKKSK
jgi:hypothetical protein